MKKLLRYKNGDEYITGSIASINPNGVEPVAEFDLDELDEKDFQKVMLNKKNIKLFKNIRRVK